MVKLVNRKLLNDIQKQGKDADINCWACSLLVLGIIDELRWLDCEEMEQYISTHFKPISRKDLKDGDMYVLYTQDGELLHTAIFTQNQWWHKDGILPSEYTTISKMNYRYRKWCNEFGNQGIKTKMMRLK